MTTGHYRIGLPAWAFPGWQGHYFDNKPSALASYARVFSTVEGNTTFYHIPSRETVAGWCDSLAGTELDICFKLPRTITHEKVPRSNDVLTFFKRIEPLQAHIGPVLLQFPAIVGPEQLGRLDTLFAQLPREYRYVLEVRHQRFFSHPELLEPLLEKYGYGRVIMDTRAVFHGDRTHPEVQSAVHDKPDLPVLKRVYNELLLIRLLLHPEPGSNDEYINLWAVRVAQALKKQISCYMMIHCPNNYHCPAQAVQFHEALRAQGVDLPALTSWPIPQQVKLL